ncbi:PREDICTED: CRS2-associated factor 1, mitochondrial-like [Camelina sativa]|uniref:CRS2-associated factor 1, mitochondrial-like n=1 Tax=Camelina sativa TaxID=90675 RepID=A0ABM0TXL5_CAMSA|nr:PREDICTED: CRS2-associated factor 1, mitochondrial-like [Camelina sativa]
MLLIRLSRHNRSSFTLLTRRLHSASDQTESSSRLRDHYNFQPPPPLSLASENHDFIQKKKKPKPQYRPPSSLEGVKKMHSDLPFDFRFSYTESSSNVRPIGLREPKYSPFGPQRLDREWTGVCAPAVDPKLESVDGVEDPNLEEKRRKLREKIQGASLTEAERKFLVELCQRNKTKRQVNLGRDGLTYNMLNDIYNHWKHAEAVRVKCLGVPTLDMKNVIFHLEDKTFGQVVSKHSGTLVLYRGRNYDPKKRPRIPLMLWKPHELVYPRLIKTTIDGLSIEETKAMRKKGLAVPALTKLAKNGYYGSLVPMLRDAFLVSELRIDCLGLERKDYKKIGAKLRDLVLCILVTFDKEQVVIWRGKDYKPPNDDDEYSSFIHRESSIDTDFKL